MSQVGQWQDTWPAGMTATMDVTYTQANAAGGAIVCEITPGVGNEFIVYAARAKNTGTNGIQMLLEPAATNVVAVQTYTVIGSGAGTDGLLGATTTLTPAIVPIAPPGILVSGTQTFNIKQTGAGAQNDTFRVLINIRLRGRLPDVTHANSTNAANVSVTAGTEAFATL